MLLSREHSNLRPVSSLAARRLAGMIVMAGVSELHPSVPSSRAKLVNSRVPVPWLRAVSHALVLYGSEYFLQQRESHAPSARSTEHATEGKYLNYSHSAKKALASQTSAD
jgi:hypothetical protein